MQCEICPSESNVKPTDVGLHCCEDCRKLFGFDEVKPGPEEPAADNETLSL